MKGIVFTEYLEFVEDSFGFDIAQEMIDKSELTNDAIYTSVGTYDSAELVKMVVQLSKIVNIEVPDLLISYGQHLFIQFTILYPHFFHNNITIFDFINKIDDYIHVEVKKLYPDAELPEVRTLRRDDDMIEIIYSSSRKFGDFAHGLLLGAISFFEEDMEISSRLLEDDGSKIKFILKRKF